MCKHIGVLAVALRTLDAALRGHVLGAGGGDAALTDAAAAGVVSVVDDHASRSANGTSQPAPLMAYSPAPSALQPVISHALKFGDMSDTPALPGTPAVRLLVLESESRSSPAQLLSDVNEAIQGIYSARFQHQIKRMVAAHAKGKPSVLRPIRLDGDSIIGTSAAVVCKVTELAGTWVIDGTAGTMNRTSDVDESAISKSLMEAEHIAELSMIAAAKKAARMVRPPMSFRWSIIDAISLHLAREHGVCGSAPTATADRQGKQGSADLAGGASLSFVLPGRRNQGVSGSRTSVNAGSAAELDRLSLAISQDRAAVVLIEASTHYPLCEALLLSAIPATAYSSDRIAPAASAPITEPGASAASVYGIVSKPSTHAMPQPRSPRVCHSADGSLSLALAQLQETATGFHVLLRVQHRPPADGTSAAANASAGWTIANQDVRLGRGGRILVVTAHNDGSGSAGTRHAADVGADGSKQPRSCSIRVVLAEPAEADTVLTKVSKARGLAWFFLRKDHIVSARLTGLVSSSSTAAIAGSSIGGAAMLEPSALPVWLPPRTKDGKLIGPRDPEAGSMDKMYAAGLHLPPVLYDKSTGDFVSRVNMMWHASELQRGRGGSGKMDSGARYELKDSLQILFYRALRGRRVVIPYGTRPTLERSHSERQGGPEALCCDILFIVHGVHQDGEGSPLLSLSALDLGAMDAPTRAKVKKSEVGRVEEVITSTLRGVALAAAEAGDPGGSRGPLLLSVVASRDELPLMRGILARNAARTKVSKQQSKAFPSPPWVHTFLTPDYADAREGIRAQLNNSSGVREDLKAVKIAAKLGDSETIAELDTLMRQMSALDDSTDSATTTARKTVKPAAGVAAAPAATVGASATAAAASSTSASASGLVQSCANCGKSALDVPEGLVRCSRCKTTWYCGTDCQRSHWKAHKPSCTSVSERLRIA